MWSLREFGQNLLGDCLSLRGVHSYCLLITVAHIPNAGGIDSSDVLRVNWGVMGTWTTFTENTL